MLIYLIYDLDLEETTAISLIYYLKRIILY